MPGVTWGQHPPCACDACVAAIMEAVGIGHRHGLEAAQARINGDTFIAPLTWNKVRQQLLDFGPDRVLDDG